MTAVNQRLMNCARTTILRLRNRNSIPSKKFSQLSIVTDMMMIIFTGKGYQFLRYAIFLSDAFIAIHMWCARRAGILFSLNRLNLYTWRMPVRVFAATTETQF